MEFWPTRWALAKLSSPSPFWLKLSLRRVPSKSNIGSRITLLLCPKLLSASGARRSLSGVLPYAVSLSTEARRRDNLK